MRLGEQRNVVGIFEVRGHPDASNQECVAFGHMGSLVHLEAQCNGEEEGGERAALVNAMVHMKLGGEARIKSDVAGQHSQ